MNMLNKRLSILFILFLFMGSVFAITIESKKQEMRLDENKGYFTGDVKVQVGDVVVQSPRADLDLEPATKKPSLATFFDKPYANQIKNNKKHEVKADIIKVSLIKKVITAVGNTQTNVLEDKKPTVIITADMQEYDTNTSLMKAIGKVVINYDEITATSDEAYALMDKNNEIQNLKLSKKAMLQKEKNIIKADNIQYSKLREDIIATGNTISDITFDDGDRVIITARSQQYDRLGNKMMASGAVHVVTKEYVADGPKAIMYINAKTNKPEKIVFVGRSKIVENKVNSVEADRITMIIKPKHFEAEGHVKTNIDENSSNNSNDKMEFSL